MSHQAEPGREDEPPPDAAMLSAVGAVVERAVGTRPTTLVPIKSGVNRVFRLAAGDRRLVVRLNELVELSRFHKEAWCIDRAQAVGVPGPEVLAVGSTEAYAYMLESDVPGTRAEALAPDEQLSVWRTLGSYLRRIHDIPVAGFGEELADITSGSEAQWRRYVDYNLDQLTPTDPLLRTGVLTSADHARLRIEFQTLRSASLRFGLSHGDCSLFNTICGDGGTTTLIDWGEAHAHVVPHYDLGVTERASVRDYSPGFIALLEGYGLDRAGYASLRPQVHALRRLIATDKVRWARERRPDRLVDKVAVLRHEMGLAE